MLLLDSVLRYSIQHVIFAFASFNSNLSFAKWYLLLFQALKCVLCLDNGLALVGTLTTRCAPGVVIYSSCLDLHTVIKSTDWH